MGIEQQFTAEPFRSLQRKSMMVRVVFFLALKQKSYRHLAKTIAKDHTKLSPEETRSIGLVLC
jgi:hypothetical protein